MLTSLFFLHQPAYIFREPPALVCAQHLTEQLLQSRAVAAARRILHGLCVQHVADFHSVGGLGQPLYALGLALPLKLPAYILEIPHVLTPPEVFLSIIFSKIPFDNKKPRRIVPGAAQGDVTRMKVEIKAAVFSDTHGSNALMLEAVRRCRPDVLIHLGDYERDADVLRMEFPEIPLYSVRGNCDIGGTAPDRDVVPLGPVKAFITHGHLYGVKYGRLDSLVYAAMEQGAKIAMFGHTHEADYEEMGGVKLINPGTAGVGRERTWALVEIYENGGIACEIKEL